MKETTKSKLAKYQRELQEAVILGVKYHTAKKALMALPLTYAIETALMEIKGQSKLYNNLVKTTTRNIAVLELREGI